jgi:hypothetical protein
VRRPATTFRGRARFTVAGDMWQLVARRTLMVTVRPATTADLDAVVEFLARTLRGGPPARYRRFLSYAWPVDKPHLGYLIEEGGVHGFMGSIFSERHIGGRTHRICNLHSLAVDESHRKHTLQLFKHFLADKTLTYTCFSASPPTAEILRFFKFEELPGARVIVTPLSGLAGLRSAVLPPRVRVTGAPDEIDALLDDEHERRIARDHRLYRCAQLVIARGDRRCLVVAVRRGRGRRHFADILHASDKQLLMQSLPWLHLPLARQLRTALTGIDRRWMAAPPRASFVYANLRPLHVRSPSLAPPDIDALYSEFVPMYG